MYARGRKNGTDMKATTRDSKGRRILSQVFEGLYSSKKNKRLLALTQKKVGANSKTLPGVMSINFYVVSQIFSDWNIFIYYIPLWNYLSITRITDDKFLTNIFAISYWLCKDLVMRISRTLNVNRKDEIRQMLSVYIPHDKSDDLAMSYNYHKPVAYKEL